MASSPTPTPLDGTGPFDLLAQRSTHYLAPGSDLRHQVRRCRSRSEVFTGHLADAPAPSDWCSSCSMLVAHLLRAWQRRDDRSPDPAVAVVLLDRPSGQAPMSYLRRAVAHGRCVDPLVGQGWVAPVAGVRARWLRALSPGLLRERGVRLHLLEPDERLQELVVELWRPDSPAYRDPADAIAGARLLLP